MKISIRSGEAVKELTKIEEILLLTIWKLGDEAYGYRIRRQIMGIIKKDFTYGNLYSALSQLSKKKYVTKRLGETVAARRGKIRIYYKLSPAGREALKAALETTRALWDGVTRYALETEGR
jgi:PadR family transcriptional regulator PadR